jgi:hypothetical protein
MLYARTSAQEYAHGFIKLVDIKTIHAHGIKLKVPIKRLVSDIRRDRLVLETICAQISFGSK